MNFNGMFIVPTKNKNFKYIYSEEKNIFLMLLNYVYVLSGNKNIGVRK